MTTLPRRIKGHLDLDAAYGEHIDEPMPPVRIHNNHVHELKLLATAFIAPLLVPLIIIVGIWVAWNEVKVAERVARW